MARRLVVLTCVVALSALAACKQTPQKTPATTAATSTSSTGSVGGPVATLPQPPAAPAITSPNAKPMWVDSIGPWKEEWREKHASKGDAAASRYEWVVGTSQPVENESQDALARQSASQDAIFHFMRLLGMDFESNARTGEVWSTAQTGHLVNAIYRKSLQDEMFKNKVNLDAYDSWPYTVTQGLVKRYVVKVLYRVDMGKFAEQNVLQKAKDNMIQDLKRTRELTEAEREKAIRAAQKLVDDAIATNPLLKPAQK